MASTSEKRLWWADWRCNPLQMDAVAFPGVDRDWNLPVADAAVPAFELFADLMRQHDYLFREVSGGTYKCRKIGGTDSWSLHAYGIAIDLNPSKNPYGTTTHDFPQDFIEEVLATGLFRWGMTFRDPMHWEIDVPPDQIGDDMPLSQEDKDFILAAVRGDNVEQTDSVWQRYAIRNNAGELVSLINAIQFIYRKLEAGGSLDVDEAAVANAVLSKINLKQAG